MQDTTLTIDLERLKPVACSPAFSSMLGYHNESRCLSLFDRVGHIDGYNLLQLSRLPEKAVGIPILDRQLQPVGKVEAIKIDDALNIMTITARRNRDGSKKNHRLPDWLSEGDDATIVPVVIKPGQNTVLVDEALAQRLALDRKEDGYDLESYLAAIRDEDRSVIGKVLTALKLPEAHNLFYRIVTTRGEMIAVEHWFEQDSSGGQLSLYGYLRTCDPGKPSQTRLQTLAIYHGLNAAGNETISTPDVGNIHRFLDLLKTCLKDEGFQPTMKLSVGKVVGFCSLCSEQVNTTQTALKITCAGYRPGRRELLDLIERDYSIVDLNGHATWKSLFSYAHQRGYHVILGIGHDRCLELQLQISDSGHD